MKERRLMGIEDCRRDAEFTHGSYIVTTDSLLAMILAARDVPNWHMRLCGAQR